MPGQSQREGPAIGTCDQTSALLLPNSDQSLHLAFVMLLKWRGKHYVQSGSNYIIFGRQNLSFFKSFFPFLILDSRNCQTPCSHHWGCTNILALSFWACGKIALWAFGKISAPRSNLLWPMKGEQKWPVLLPGGNLKSQRMLCYVSPTKLVTGNIPNSGCSVSLGPKVSKTAKVWSQPPAHLWWTHSTCRNKALWFWDPKIWSHYCSKT